MTSAPSTQPAIPSGVSPAVSCALSCNAGDVNCQASCLGNARPNASQAIATNECAAKCDQGDGSTAASQAYAKCVDSCINSLFPSSQTAFVGNGGVAAASSGTPSGTGSVKATATAPSGMFKTPAQRRENHMNANTSPGTASTSGPAASTQSGAADMKSAHVAGAGLAGLFAIFAL